MSKAQDVNLTAGLVAPGGGRSMAPSYVRRGGSTLTRLFIIGIPKLKKKEILQVRHRQDVFYEMIYPMIT